MDDERKNYPDPEDPTSKRMHHQQRYTVSKFLGKILTVLIKEEIYSALE